MSSRIQSGKKSEFKSGGRNNIELADEAEFAESIVDSSQVDGADNKLLESSQIHHNTFMNNSF